MVTVLGPESLEPIGESFRIPIPASMRDRIETARARHAEKDGEKAAPLFWELRLRVAARPTFAPRRELAGPFDYPQLIGPYAEFGYTVDVENVRAVTREEIEENRAGRGGEAEEPVDR
jgi:hypothetical protein